VIGAEREASCATRGASSRRPPAHLSIQYAVQRARQRRLRPRMRDDVLVIDIGEGGRRTVPIARGRWRGRRPDHEHFAGDFVDDRDHELRTAATAAGSRKEMIKVDKEKQSTVSEARRRSTVEARSRGSDSARGHRTPSASPAARSSRRRGRPRGSSSNLRYEFQHGQERVLLAGGGSQNQGLGPRIRDGEVAPGEGR